MGNIRISLAVMPQVALDAIEAVGNKVDKIEGKGLSTEDFTSALKTKLESLNNYNDNEIRLAVNNLRNDLDTLVSGDITSAIEAFNEIITFLEGIDDSENLDNIIASILTQLNSKGTYSKPSTGIPVTDLSGPVQTSLANADNALPLKGGLMDGAITTPGTDIAAIIPANDNYDTIGSEEFRFWQIHVSEIYGETVNSSEVYSTEFYQNGESISNLYAPNEVASYTLNGLMSTEDKIKLDGIANGATANTGTVTSITPGTGLTGISSDTAITTSGTINLKKASTSEIGGIKASNALTTTLTLTSSNGTTASRYYGVLVDSAGTAFVNVPWTDTKNTAGAGNSTSQLYIIGAQGQGSNPQTYSNSTCYMNGGVLYSGGYITNTSANIANKVITGTPQLFAPINLQRKVYVPLQYNDGTLDRSIGESRHAINYIRISGDHDNNGAPVNLSSPITIVEVSNYTGTELWLNIPKLSVAEYNFSNNTPINPYTNVDNTKFRTSRKVIIYFLGKSTLNLGYIGFTSASGDPSVNIHSNSIYTNGEFAEVDTVGSFLYHPYLRKLECDILLDAELTFYQISATSHIISHT